MPSWCSPQSVQGVKDARPGEGSQVPWQSHSSSHQPGHQKGQEQSSSMSASVDGGETCGNGEKFMRRGVCLLSSQCGAADTMDLSSFIPPLICVPAPHCGRLIMDRKGRQTLQLPPVHLEGGNDSSLDLHPQLFLQREHKPGSCLSCLEIPHSSPPWQSPGKAEAAVHNL